MGRQCGKTEDMCRDLARHIMTCGSPRFSKVWFNEWKEEIDSMTNPKPDLEKFDPSEWECPGREGTFDSTKAAVQCMIDGYPVWSRTRGFWFALIGERFCSWNYVSKGWDSNSIQSQNQWLIAVHKPKPEPKPATSDEILNALKCGKTVVDADGCQVDLFWKDTPHDNWVRNVCFPLTIKPTPKPRRRVTREEAIVAMVKDQAQHVWSANGSEYRWDIPCCSMQVHCSMRHCWVGTFSVPDHLYLDPPEGKT
jgi:hypothetical protein